MKRRIGGQGTGLGGNAETLLNNRKKLNKVQKAFVKEAVDLYFQKWGGCDYQIEPDGIKCGIEPSYMYEPLKLVYLAKDKQRSYLQTGRAVGAWASAILQTKRFYADYKYNSKFKRFIDKWHSKLLIPPPL